ncbi:MAG: phosphoethanolamine transferase [Nitrospinales bacterium]
MHPLLAVFLVIAPFSYNYENRNDLRVIFDWKVEIQKYAFELSKFKDQQKNNNTRQIKFLAEKEHSGETYVVIIGESLNKNHMQLYGYGRDTTPYLSRLFSNNEIIIFKNAYSNHTHSVPVLTYALTEANQQNNKPFEESILIVDIFNKAGFETHWVTNQALYGLWDNQVTVMAKNAGSMIALNRGVANSIHPGFYDEEALKYVKNIIGSNKNNNKVLFVHLFGNHWEYCSRFPNEYKKYEGNLDINIFGELAKATKNQSNINCYDNSVLYNDFIVTSIIDIAKQQGGVSGVVYFSDHGEEVINVQGHNADNFTFSMTQIPLLFWFSEEYKNRYKEKMIHLNRNVDKLFPNGLVYDSLIGALDIKTGNYNAFYDISSAKYDASNIKHLTLHGERDYLDSDNINYWQRKNIAKLKSIGQENRVIPLRVNTVGKLKHIFNDGFHAIETDINFREDAGGYFEVGHGENTLSEMSLEKYLSILPFDALSKVWLDIKNIDEDNVKSALDRLLFLDDKYKLKDRTIIESSFTHSSFSAISKAGFHTSYYLPTSLILELESLDEVGQKELALDISEQINKQKTAAISFNIKLYPFVKNFIETNLKKSLSYHVWDSSIQVGDTEFLSNLQSRAFFVDKKVKTILVSYHSLFDL